MTADPVPKTRHSKALDHRRKAWAKLAPKYDKKIDLFERKVLGEEHRAWACSKASGETLEVAIGTGLNLPHYPPDVSLTGIDLSPEMLAIARDRATELDRSVDLREADAQALPFPDASFDTVVCTYSLCNVPDDALAIGEMKRVLKPGGRLILVDHIRSAVKPIFWVQKVWELFSVPIDGDHQTRRPLLHVKAAGFEVETRDRMRWGILERLVATKPEVKRN
ncbi:MAG TPA: class I SAM-dependent methyltransferase [Actinomycetota bacterium]|nr:class I SAM-dependent methyltransferase [Actinomycetota bacterium]